MNLSCSSREVMMRIAHYTAYSTAYNGIFVIQGSSLQFFSDSRKARFGLNFSQKNLKLLALVFDSAFTSNMNELFSKEDFTMVKNPGTEQMEIITKKGEKIETYKASDEQETTGSRGRKVGTAYQLESGEIIYVPDN